MEILFFLFSITAKPSSSFPASEEPHGGWQAEDLCIWIAQLLALQLSNSCFSIQRV